MREANAESEQSMLPSTNTSGQSVALASTSSHQRRPAAICVNRHGLKEQVFGISVFGIYVSDTAEGALRRPMGRGIGASSGNTAEAGQLIAVNCTLLVAAILQRIANNKGLFYHWEDPQLISVCYMSTAIYIAQISTVRRHPLRVINGSQEVEHGALQLDHAPIVPPV